jgi:CheY-like chemotaxis protein
MGLPRSRVFVVDDEQVIVFTLAAILNQSGFSAVPFTDPLAALEAAASDPPNLLISDVMMPQLTGIELAVQVTAKLPDCKVLLFSGQAATAGLLNAAREHGRDFVLLSKPIHPTDLLSAIQKLTT